MPVDVSVSSDVYVTAGFKMLKAHEGYVILSG